MSEASVVMKFVDEYSAKAALGIKKAEAFRFRLKSMPFQEQSGVITKIGAFSTATTTRVSDRHSGAFPSDQQCVPAFGVYRRSSQVEPLPIRL